MGNGTSKASRKTNGVQPGQTADQTKMRRSDPVLIFALRGVVQGMGQHRTP